MGRNAIGVDIDPVATFVSRVKSKPLDPEILERTLAKLQEKLKETRRPRSEYARLKFKDLSLATLSRHRNRLGIPAIPTLTHWFKSYVAIDLANIKKIIADMPMAPAVRAFFLSVFTSIIRNASNADPVPVSGLEVTSFMRKLDKAGRFIDSYELFERRAKREIRGMTELWRTSQPIQIRVIRSDSTNFAHRLGKTRVDAIITSPPYNTSVDYYRRHMLEMYWLDFVHNHKDRLKLANRYIGRTSVARRMTRLSATFTSSYVNNLIRTSRKVSLLRERVVRHYCASMQSALLQCANVLKPGGRAVFVVGNSKWNGKRVKATKLLVELAKPQFHLVEKLSYPTRNRYMSYSRHNGADVDHEHVVVLRKRHNRRRTRT